MELIGQMPQTGRRLYDLFCGRDAKQMLDDALASGDTNKLARVAGAVFSHRGRLRRRLSCWG